MEASALKDEKFLEILPKNTSVGRGKVLRKRRMLLGSSDACDLRFNASSIEAIHAVIEITGNIGKIYDMASSSGVYVNNKKVSVSEIRVGDSLKIGGHEFEIKVFDKSDVMPPPLQMLQGGIIEDRPKIMPSENVIQRPQVPQAPQTLQTPQTSQAPQTLQTSQSPQTPQTPQSSQIPQAPSAPQQPPQMAPPEMVKDEFVPRVQYPLAKDPNADFSEYIFEDVESLYPIFNYNFGTAAIEVIILFDGQIYSVDYLPVKNGIYKLVGYGSKKSEIEYASLRKGEKVEFVSVQAGEVFVNPLPGYKMKTLDEEGQDVQSTVHLLDDDIVFCERDLIKIFVRRTEHPPQVKCAPVFRRDEGFKKYLTLIMCMVFLFLGFISFLEVNPEKKQKDPERIATVLYKKRKFKVKKKKLVVEKKTPPDKTKNAPKKVAQKSPVQKKVEKKPTPKPVKKVAQKAGKKSPKVGKVRKAKPKKGPPNKIKKVTASNKPSPKKGSSPAKKSGPKRKAAPSKAVGSVDTYKAFDFKSTVSALMAKGGGAKSVKTSTYSSSVGSGGVTGSSASARSQLASVSKNVGSLTGAASGRLDQASGAEGLSSKRGIFTAGLPSNTVVLGGMDPDIIRRILLDHVPQFRSCYQNVLDRSTAAFNGVGKFNFLIGSSGYVTKAGINTGSSVPSSVKKCTVNILKGIKFPAPQGGGVVEVNQPFNFLAKGR